MGKRKDDRELPAGWYRVPSMPNTQRFWDGSDWTDQVAPIGPEPVSLWKGIRIVALGVLVAVAVLWYVLGIFHAGDASDCATQQFEFNTGERTYSQLDTSCR